MAAKPKVHLAKVEKAWAEREKIRADLETRIPSIKERSMKNAELVADLLSVRNQNNAIR